MLKLIEQLFLSLNKLTRCDYISKIKYKIKKFKTNKKLGKFIDSENQPPYQQVGLTSHHILSLLH